MLAAPPAWCMLASLAWAAVASANAASFGAAATSLDASSVTTLTAQPARQRPLLIYIPFHVSEPASHIAKFCECTLRWAPWRGRATLPFDVLLSISGRTSAGNEAELKAMLEDAVAHLSPRPRVYVEFVTLQSDRYVQDVEKEQKDADWVGGPNTAFYDAMLDGQVYRNHVRRYEFVQQLETDVCALKSGWLDDLVAPVVANADVVISGASIKGDCIYIKAHDQCEAVTEAPVHMRQHVNGNALYRVSTDLRDVLQRAKTTFGNSEPFDLAIYWTMEALGVQSKLHVNPVYYNMAALVDTDWYLDAAYYGGRATMVHVPRRLRSCGLRSAVARGYIGLPLVVVVVEDDVQPAAVQRLVRSLQKHQIERYVFLAASQRAYVTVSKDHPFRVVPAFTTTHQSTTVQGGDHNGPPATELTWLPTEQACGPWMPAVATPAAVMFAVAARLVRVGFAPLVVDQRAVFVQDHELTLFQVPADGIYITEQDVARLVGRGANASQWWPRLAFFPRSEAVASAADLAATNATTDWRQMPWKTLAPDQIAVGGPWDDLSFPLALRRRQLIRSSDADMLAFDAMQSRVPRFATANCTNYTVAARRSVDTATMNVGDTVGRIVDAVACARVHKVSCVVLPSVVFRRRSAASIFKVVDAAFMGQLAGDGTTLVPSMENVDTDAAAYVDIERLTKPSQGSTMCGSHSRPHACLTHDVRRVLAAAAGVLGGDFVCVRAHTGAGDNAHVLRVQMNNLYESVDGLLARKRLGSSTKVFVRGGGWRYLPATAWSHVTRRHFSTLAHVRVALQGSSEPAQPLARTDNIAFDDAWADVVESAICADAKGELDIGLHSSVSGYDPAFLTGMPASDVTHDLAALTAWWHRRDRTTLQGPFVVMHPPHAHNLSCTDWVRTARLGLLLGHAANARHVVLPPLDAALRAFVNATAMYAAFPAVLPTAVALLMQPRLTFFDADLEASPSTADHSATWTTYAQPLNIIQRSVRTSNSIMWTLNATDTCHATMRHALQPSDWVVVRNDAHRLADLDRVMRAAAITSDKSGRGGAYVQRVDAFWGGVCGGA